MTLLIPHLTQAAAATIINIIVFFLQYTLPLALVALLIYAIPPINSALAWNVIGRSIHASLCPTLLRTDTSSLRGTGWRVAVYSYLSVTITALVAIAGILMPLGLGAGHPVLAPLKITPSSFVADTSPLGLATSPRGAYVYSRICGTFEYVTCPGSSDTSTSAIAPDVVATFNATPYSPFSMQFRRYYIGSSPGIDGTLFYSQFSTTESLILRTGIFAVGGLIVDMDNPGIGLWNHTLPVETPHGGMWQQDVLWLEPVSSCVDTNLTLDYTLSNAVSTHENDKFNLTDRGGFFNLTHDFPTLNRSGQQGDLWQHAYAGAVLSNFVAMESLNNLTRNESFQAGKMQVMDLWFLQGATNTSANSTAATGLGPDLHTLCQGYSAADTANITNIAVHCYLLVAPPQRSDGGDPRLPADNSTWTQQIFSCAGGTRARMQHVEFSFNGTMDLTALSFSRSDMETPVLWATEKTELTVGDVNLFWGRVSDSLDGDPSLWTTRSDVFYIPAGATDAGLLGPVTISPQTSTLPALAWNSIQQLATGASSDTSVADYTALSNFALYNKFQTLISTNPQSGAEQMQNLMWTDLMANNVLGTTSNSSLLVQANVPSISYDLRFAVPALLLLLLWVPLFGGAVCVLLTGLLKLSHVRHLLNYTGAGRVALGSALRPVYPESSRLTADPGTPRADDEKYWAKGAGRTPVGIQPSGWSAPYSDNSTEFVPLSTYKQ
ncbi:hypothetical protein MSAN_01771300 [Mycena sanguinolenta]|uniref:Uncharacterized protein n=1 Tax=Mycena sanguinolenta TaxID=230812 RepID=A0A8H6XXH5_9AGAR|nr:hypothetical protein MSAN_01771300 [Mycena sanguinolenta]